MKVNCLKCLDSHKSSGSLLNPGLLYFVFPPFPAAPALHYLPGTGIRELGWRIGHAVHKKSWKAT